MRNILCDFCNAEIDITQSTEIVGHPIQCVLVGDGVRADINHDAEWAACDRCASLIESKQWEALLMLVRCSLDLVDDPIIDLVLRHTYSKAFDVPELTQRASAMREQSNNYVVNIYA